MISFFSESSNGLSRPDKSYVEGETLLGQSYLQQIKTRANRPYSSGPYQGLPDRRFKLLDNTRIAELLRIYDEEMWIQTAADISLNPILGGGLSITDSFESDKAEEEKTALQKWRSFHYLGLIPPAFRYRQAIGFIPWQPEPNSFDVGSTCVLPFDQMMTWYAINEQGKPMYAFFRQPGADALESRSPMYFMGRLVGDPILNVYVTTYKAPSEDGKFRSIVATLEKSIKFLKDTRDDASVANSRLARPLFVTSHVPIKYNTNALDTTIPSLRIAKQNQAENLRSYMEAHRELGAAEAERVLAQISAQSRAYDGSEEGKRVVVPDGQLLENQVKPEAPKDLIQVTLMHQQSVLTAFGIPPSMILSESARGRVASGDDANAASIFNSTQMQLKQFFVQFIEQAYNVVHAHSKIEMYLMNVPLTRRLTESDVNRAVSGSVKIVLPGTPPMEFLKTLHREGMLKYPALRRYIAAMHAIPLDDLNEESELSLIDLITDGQESIQKAKAETDVKMQETELEEKEKMQIVDVKSKEKQAKMKIQAKPKAKPKAKAKAKSKSKKR